VGVGAFGLFAALAVAVARGNVPRLDSVLVPAVGYHEHSETFRRILKIAGMPGGATGTLVIVGAALILLVATRRPLSAVFLVLAVACSAASPLLKDAFDRHPPPGIRWTPPEVGFFPSGHAVGSMAVAASVVTLAWRTRFRAAAIAVALVMLFAVGVSSVVVGDHWPTDVVGGWAFSLGWVLCVSAVSAAWIAHRRDGLDGAGNAPADPSLARRSL
jgi:undecaprenyl-diphosphatase